MLFLNAEFRPSHQAENEDKDSEDEALKTECQSLSVCRACVGHGPVWLLLYDFPWPASFG